MRHKVTVAIRNAAPISVFLDDTAKDELIDQFYEICSGHLDDNFLEIRTDENCQERVLLKASEVLYIQCMESVTDVQKQA